MINGLKNKKKPEKKWAKKMRPITKYETFTGGANVMSKPHPVKVDIILWRIFFVAFFLL